MKRDHQHKFHPGLCHGYCSVFTVSNPEGRGDVASTWDYTCVSQQNKTVYTQIFTNAWFSHRFLYFFLLRLFIQNLGLLGSAARRVEWSTHYACSRSQHALIMSEASMFLLLRNLTCGAFRAQFLFCRQLPVLLGCFSLGFNGPDLWSTFRQPLPSCSLKPVQ